jgi:hypothetical protein
MGLLRWLLRAWLVRGRVRDCDDCGRPLTADERWWYATETDGRCEACERAWDERIGNWMAGRTHEPELDSYFSAPRK